MTVALQARAIQFAFLVAVFIAWFAIGRTGAISPLFLPPMEAVGVALARLGADGGILVGGRNDDADDRRGVCGSRSCSAFSPVGSSLARRT